MSNDPVYQPSHYTGLRVRTESGTIGPDNTVDVESINITRAMLTPEEFAAHCRATAFKYLFRMEKKGNPVQDARKCTRYLDWYIETMEQIQAKAKEVQP